VIRSAPTVEVLTASDAQERQGRAAGWLSAAGCRTGDRVVFCLGSSADLICAVLGAARVGVIPVLLNATLTEAERDALIADARPTISVLTQADLSRVMAGSPRELSAYPLTRPMHYTSGTTGRPKGVTTGVWDEATARAVFEDEAAVWQFDPHDLHIRRGHPALGRFAGHPQSLRCRHGTRCAATSASHHHVLGADPSAADPAAGRARE
jgi:long-chain acyl-CoA synthetase